MGRTACTEPQCLYKGALYLYLHLLEDHDEKITTEQIFEKWVVRMEGRWKWLGLFSGFLFIYF